MKDLKQIALNTIIFILICIIMIISSVSISSWVVKSRKFEIYQAESNLLALKDNAHYDLLFMGISHARNFTRHKNHIRIENILDKDIYNIAKGGGVSGVNEQLFYLKYLYNHGVKVDEIVYVLSPSLMYADFLNNASNTFDDEPFKLDFFINHIKNNSLNKTQRLMSYIQSKYKFTWILKKPTSKERKDDILKEINQQEIEAGFKLAYLDDGGKDILDQNCLIIEETVKSAKSKNTNIIFIIPPAIFGKWRGHYEAIECVEKIKNRYETEIYDFSESMLDINHYYDHHHLNSEGVSVFVEKYLKNIL